MKSFKDFSDTTGLNKVPSLNLQIDPSEAQIAVFVMYTSIPGTVDDRDALCASVHLSLMQINVSLNVNYFPGTYLTIPL